MRGQSGFFDVEDRLTRLSDLGDQLEAFARIVDFEMFRPELDAALDYSDRSKGSRPPFDPVLMFKILVIQAHNNLSDDRAEFLVNDRLSFMRFLGLGLADKAPDAKTIWFFRERLTKAGAIERLFARFDQAVREAGYIPMSGQIVDASLVAAPKQRNADGEKRDIRAGLIPAAWTAHPAKLRQKDRDARWTLVFGKARTRERTARATPTSPSRCSATRTTSASTGGMASSGAGMSPMRLHDGAMLRRGLLDPSNTASTVWADSAYRSKGERGLHGRAWLQEPGPPPQAEGPRDGAAHPPRQRHPLGRPRRRRAAHLKGAMALTIRTIGIVRARAKLGLANLTYNIRRLVLHERRAALV